MFFSPVE
jgi:predicted enzyme related to lactoylglutathione lyase